jgi:hypothetical protein
VAVFGTLFSRAVDGRTMGAAYNQGVADGTQNIFVGMLIVCVVALIAAVCIKEIPLRGSPQAPAAAPAASDVIPATRRETRTTSAFTPGPPAPLNQ